MKNTPKIKRSIVEVLKQIVAIAADGAVGPSVLEIFNTLLRHLRSSVDERLSGGQAMSGSQSASDLQQLKFDENEEILFEEAIIDTIGELKFKDVTLYSINCPKLPCLLLHNVLILCNS